MIWALHGAVGMAGDWDSLARALAADGQVLRGVDLWRFLMCEPMGMRMFARAFNSEVERAGGDDKRILLGYSMGGRLALHVLLDRPELWSGAVICSAHPGLSDAGEKVQRLAKDAEWAGRALRARPEDWLEFLELWNGQGVLGGTAPEGLEMKDRGPLKMRREAVARSFMDWSLGGQEDLLNELGGLDLPVRWVVGAEDEKFAALGERAVSFLPKGELCRVAEAGHRVPWEKPEEFAALVQKLVTEQLG